MREKKGEGKKGKLSTFLNSYCIHFATYVEDDNTEFFQIKVAQNDKYTLYILIRTVSLLIRGYIHRYGFHANGEVRLHISRSSHQVDTSYPYTGIT